MPKRRRKEEGQVSVPQRKWDGLHECTARKQVCIGKYTVCSYSTHNGHGKSCIVKLNFPPTVFKFRQVSIRNLLF